MPAARQLPSAFALMVAAAVGVTALAIPSIASGAEEPEAPSVDQWWPFGEPETLTTGDLGQPVVADFDGDGQLDLWVGRPEGGVFIAALGGSRRVETVTLSVNPDSPTHASPVDIDGDGDFDIVQMASDGGWASQMRLLDNGPDGFSLAATESARNRIITIQPADFDQDGDLDIALGQWWSKDNPPRWFRNEDGQLILEELIPGRDSGKDTTLVSMGANRLLGGGQPFPGHWLAPQSEPIEADQAWNVLDASAADFTGDGVLDIVAARGAEEVKIGGLSDILTMVWVPQRRSPADIEVNAARFGMTYRVGIEAVEVTLDADSSPVFESGTLRGQWTGDRWILTVAQGSALMELDVAASNVTTSATELTGEEQLLVTQLSTGMAQRPLSQEDRYCGSVASGDLDLDGRIDAVFGCGDVTGPAHLLVARNLGEGSFALSSRELPGRQGIIDVQLIDTDGDGALDLLAGLRDPLRGVGSVLLWPGQAEGSGARLDLGTRGVGSTVTVLGGAIRSTVVAGPSGTAHASLVGPESQIIIEWPDGTIDVVVEAESGPIRVDKGALPSVFADFTATARGPYVSVEGGPTEVEVHITNSGTAALLAVDVAVVDQLTGESLASTQIDTIGLGEQQSVVLEVSAVPAQGALDVHITPANGSERRLPAPSLLLGAGAPAEKVPYSPTLIAAVGIIGLVVAAAVAAAAAARGRRRMASAAA